MSSGRPCRAPQYLAIDTDPSDDKRGRVWACFQEDEIMPLFRSLAETIEAATYLLLSGQWFIESDGWTIATRD